MIQSTIQKSRVLAALAVALAVVLTCIFFWPEMVRIALAAMTGTQFSAHGLQVAEIDQQGRIVNLAASPAALSALMFLISISGGAIGLGLVYLLTAGDTPVAALPQGMMRRIEDSGERLEDEISNVIALLQRQLRSNDRYEGALTDADGQLKATSTAQQLQSIVTMLLSENAKVKSEISGLRRGLQSSQSQINKLRQNLTQAERLVTTDALTELKNRRWLQENLHKVSAAAKDDGVPLSIIMADIDHFKKINDTFGHRTGDEILRKFGELLVDNVTDPEAAVRYGGEEFTLILPGQRKSQAWQRAERVRHELELKQWVENKTGKPVGKVTASFGVAELRSGEAAENLVQRADEYLYKAKSSGRNRVVADE